MDPTKSAPPPETKLHFLDYWRIIRIRKTVILAVFLLVVITATLVTFILPESYASTARIKVERDRSDITELQSGGGQSLGYDPFFIQTEFEVIQSETILDPVINRLSLATKWAKTFGGRTLKTVEARRILKGKLRLTPVRNTSLIDVTVYDPSPEDARDIANAIAEEYQRHRVDERRKLTRGGIEALETRFEDQEGKIREARELVDRLRKELNINDIMASEGTGAPLLTADALRHFKQLHTENTIEYVRQQTLIDDLEKMSFEQLTEAIPTAVQDTILSSLLEQRTLADQRLVMLQKDYGPGHTEVQKAQAQVAELSTKIKQRVEGVMMALKARVNSLKRGVDKIDEEVKKAESTDIAKATESRPYWDAKRRLDELERFRQLIYLKIATEKIDVELPKTVMVQIIETAVPGMTPVKPNKPLNIALGVIIGLVVGIGLAFFIEYLDTSVKTIDDVERALQSPVLGVIPQNVGLMIEEGIESPHAEAYRVLRTNLLFSRKDEKLNTIAVVSAGAGEGKSTTVFNLAAVFAQSGQRVVVVDSDLRRPTLHKMLKVTNSIGLTNYLLKQNSLEEVIQTTNIPTLDFLASGKLPSSSLGILSSQQMRDLINELKQRYDFVFFDSPPIMGVSDASILASAVDMTLQVIQYRRYPQPMNIRAKQLIEKVGGNLVGIVLNNINMSQDESYYYYSGYYHDYYYAHRDETAAPEKGDKKEKLEINKKY